jgi:hypothetical protein
MTPLVVRMTIISDATTWSVTYKCHSGDSRGVIYSCKFFYNTGPTTFLVKADNEETKGINSLIFQSI